MKLFYPGILAVLSVLSAWGKPGGTYTLTGDEKSISAIIKADMEKYPDLYKDEPLSDYLSEFNKTNRIGTRNLIPGDELVFPETMASRKVEEAKKAEETKEEERKKKARHDGIYYFQHRFLPGLTLKAGGQFFSDLESGLPSSLIHRATEVVDSGFAESLTLKSYPEKKLYVIVFEQPAQVSHCYYAAVKEDDTGYSYYTLEKGINLFGAGDVSVLCMWEEDGTHINLGGREYDDLDSFLNEFE